MKRIKKEDERRVRISITISPDLNVFLERTTNNKSKYIESLIRKDMSERGEETKKEF